MFGYVRPYKSEMLVREYDQYKAVYCQLCREMGKLYGPLSRFALSYDVTFYVLLCLSLTDTPVTLCRKRCAVNPLKKCNYLCAEGEAYRKGAALSVILTYYKLRDALEDEGFFRSLGSRLLLPLVSRKAKKAARAYPLFDEAARQAMEDQRRAEAEGGGPDACAEPTAHLLSVLLEELGGETETLRLPLRTFGYYLGRWIYLLDAADDLEEDLKQRRFNPFTARFGLEAGQALTPEQREQKDQACNQALNATASQMIPALNLLPLDKFGPLVENVVLKGLPEIQREILFLHIRDRKRERVKL